MQAHAEPLNQLERVESMQTAKQGYWREYAIAVQPIPEDV